MGAASKIEWTDATWEPITGCTLVSEGCRNCYAAQLAAGRMQHHPSMAGLAKRNANGVAQFTNEVRFNASWLTQPLRWRKPMTIFVCSRGDLFHPYVPDEWIDQVFAVMALAPHHFFRVLTKRPERMLDYVSDKSPSRADGRGSSLIEIARRVGLDKNGVTLESYRWPLPNVGLGVSVEDQATADERIPRLLATPAAMRFVSAEPLLGAVDFDTAWHGESALSAECWGDCGWCKKGHPPLHNCQAGMGDWQLQRSGLDEIIVGGESGKQARPMHPDWVRSLRDQCAEADVAFFFKQWGEWLPWEPEHGPCWKSQDGRSEDAHRLFPADFDNQTRWDDGLSFVSSGESHAAFERVGKKAAGAKLDGRDHLDVAPQVTAHFAKPGRAT